MKSMTKKCLAFAAFLSAFGAAGVGVLALLGVVDESWPGWLLLLLFFVLNDLYKRADIQPGGGD